MRTATTTAAATTVAANSTARSNEVNLNELLEDCLALQAKLKATKIPTTPSTVTMMSDIKKVLLKLPDALNENENNDPIEEDTIKEANPMETVLEEFVLEESGNDENGILDEEHTDTLAINVGLSDENADNVVVNAASPDMNNNTLAAKSSNEDDDTAVKLKVVGEECHTLQERFRKMRSYVLSINTLDELRSAVKELSDLMTKKSEIQKRFIELHSKNASTV